ncbi:MAG: tetratricopeptide repeat protein [Xanthomonadaceae bacterium]|nr:tetratricopeptide repeat protein [Xanthomonadaceae bacterium]MDE1963894.1 tetratricopeptide repeat protein [Xanthomonadaceae bacterium]
MTVSRPLRFLSLSVASLLAGCMADSPPAPTVPPPPSPQAMLNAIRAAGASEKSVIDVSPLREPGVATLQDAAQADERAGRFKAAADKLDQALRLSPESPDLLQDRAELAVRLQEFPVAEKLAQESWSIGPRLGPLCARNWQTVVEIRLHDGDAAGAVKARQQRQTCHKPGINRY